MNEKSKEETNMNWFFNSNSASARLLRTIIQGILGVLVANIDVFMGYTSLSIEMRSIVVALVMAILSPIMKEIGKKLQKDEDHE